MPVPIFEPSTGTATPKLAGAAPSAEIVT